MQRSLQEPGRDAPSLRAPFLAPARAATSQFPLSAEMPHPYIQYHWSSIFRFLFSVGCGRIINAYVRPYNHAAFLMQLVKITPGFFCLFFSAVYALFQAKSLANRESPCFDHWRCLSLLNRTTRFISKPWEGSN